MNDQVTFVGNWGSILLGPLGDCENPPLSILLLKGKEAGMFAGESKGV